MCEPCAEADLIEMSVDMEKHISELIRQGQKHYQKECDHGILQGKTATPLTNMHWELAKGQVFCKMRDGMQFPRNEAPNNAVL